MVMVGDPRVEVVVSAAMNIRDVSSEVPDYTQVYIWYCISSSRQEASDMHF